MAYRFGDGLLDEGFLASRWPFFFGALGISGENRTKH
jgi:hypothetical protein